MGILEHSRHVLEVRCTHLLDGVWSFKLRLILNLTAVTSCQWPYLFECGVFRLPNLTLTQFPDRRLSLITRVVVYFGTWARECDTLSRVIVSLLRMCTDILSDALGRVHNLLRIWIIPVCVFFWLLLVAILAIARLHRLHAVVGLFECELAPQFFVLLGRLESEIPGRGIERVGLIILGNTGGLWFSWFFYRACIYGFCIFVRVEILPCLFTAPDALGGTNGKGSIWACGNGGRVVELVHWAWVRHKSGYN